MNKLIETNYVKYDQSWFYNAINTLSAKKYKNFKFQSVTSAKMIRIG